MIRRTGADWLLIILDLFTAVTAIPCGILLVALPDGSALHAPLLLLEGSPFTDYVIPGLILALVVGGSTAAALVLLFRHAAKGPFIAAASGAVVIGWIMGQVILLRAYHPLQAIYGTIGLLLLVIGLLRNRSAMQEG